ncbi:hypothetical protein J6590_075463 [Homalodisca vitripennis]|nr:hypothetical protein J6590_075463 [Homalodisca vitripennis]
MFANVYCPELAKIDFTGSLFNHNRRSRKRTPPKLGAKHKKQPHATSGKRDKERQNFHTVSLGRLAAPVPLTALTGTLLNPNITIKREKEKNNYLPKVVELASHGHQDEQSTARESSRLCRTYPTARAVAAAGKQLKIINTLTESLPHRLTKVAEVGKITDKNVQTEPRLIT